MQPIGGHTANNETFKRLSVNELTGGDALVSGSVSGVEGKSP
jgi:hypothetical protein